MKKNILFALISLCLWACSEDEIKPYQGEQYLYFSQLINTTNDYDKENGYMEVSFNNYPTREEITVQHETFIPENKELTMQEYEKIKIVFNNVVSKPEWWTPQVTRVYLGTYSRKKYEEFVKCTGVTNFGALNTAEKRAYSLTFKRYIAQNNVMDVDADGKEFPMTVPIN